jgi:UDP-glucose 4-epimerase
MAGRFLVTGGAGYVGSHLVAAIVDRSGDVEVIDNLSQGHRSAVPPQAKLHVVDLGAPDAVDAVLARGGWDAVFHFACRSLVGESMQRPFRYLIDNTVAGIGLIEACVRHGVRRFVLSSTANLFGSATTVPIEADAPVDPGSPYGESKRMLERALYWADRIHGLRSASLRYFNAAGADPAGRLGEDHRPETHLVPLVIDAALGRGSALEVFGNDYPTPDGTCVRDYVHVSDLAAAHLQVLDQLDRGSVVHNLGSGRGHSVLEVIAAVEAVTGLRVPYRVAARRPGDPAVLVASSDGFARDCGWVPQLADLHDIVRTAYAWRVAHPAGYRD